MTMPAADSDLTTVPFGRDTTLRWSCRSGDFVLWMRWRYMFSARPRLRILGAWKMRDGDYVTITNRLEDLPCWFQLHPREVHGTAIYKMQEKLEAGYKPGEPVDAPNLWRALVGDRLVWVGRGRPAMKSGDGVLSLLEFRDNALIIGESNGSGAGLLFFGFSGKDQKPEEVALGQAAVEAVSKLGIPNECPDLDERWTIG